MASLLHGLSLPLEVCNMESLPSVLFFTYCRGTIILIAVFCCCVSPSEVQLNSLDEVRHYLLSEGTCKCGLHCPLDVEKTFIFDKTQTESRHLHADDVSLELDRASNLCNHRRKIVAMAAFHQSTGLCISRQDTTGSNETMKASLPISTLGWCFHV